MTPEEIRVRYNELSETYEGTYLSGDPNTNHYLFDDWMAARWFKDSRMTFDHAVVLGCGSGNDIITLGYPLPEKYTGYDFSAGMLANANEKFPSYSFHEWNCLDMTGDKGDLLVSAFGVPNYIGAAKLIQHYNDVQANKAFFIFYENHYDDVAPISTQYDYTQDELVEYFGQFKANVHKLWIKSPTSMAEYNVVWWDES